MAKNTIKTMAATTTPETNISALALYEQGESETINAALTEFMNSVTKDLSKRRTVEITEDGLFRATYSRFDDIDKKLIVTNELSAKKLDCLLAFDSSSKRATLALCRVLATVSEDELENFGFNSVADLAHSLTNIASSTTKLYAKIGRRFITNDFQIRSIVADFSTVGQLQELLPLDDKDLLEAVKSGKISPNVTTKKLREQVKAVKPVEERDSGGKAGRKAKSSSTTPATPEEASTIAINSLAYLSSSNPSKFQETLVQILTTYGDTINNWGYILTDTAHFEN